MNLETSTPIPSMRVLKIGTCPSQSGKGKLTYNIACTPTSEIHFRVTANSGGGYFSPEWVALSAIQDAFDKGVKPVTSFALWPLFTGKSVNTPAFLFAALKNEGLLVNDEDNPRCYVCVPPDAFMSEVKGLIDTGVNLKVNEKVVGEGVVRIKPKTKDVVPVMKPPSKASVKKSKQA